MNRRKYSFAIVAAFASAMAFSSAARAEVPIPTGTTPTLYGAERLEPGTFVIGATTGYPQTNFDIYIGLAQFFDIGVHLGLTYGGAVSGKRQGVGTSIHIPLRFSVIQKEGLAGGLKLSPYFMIGDGSPSISAGADFAFLFDIALPKLFKIIVGPEVRTGFASTGQDDWRFTRYDGAAWVVMGLETFLIDKFHVGATFNGGAQWGPHGTAGIFRGLVYFGAKM